jgi:predicted dehydrogenase
VLGDTSAYAVDGLDNQEPALKKYQWPGSDGYGVTPESEWGTLGIDGSAEGLTRVPTEAGNYPGFYAGVVESIRTGAPAPVDPRESLEVVRIIEHAHAMSTRALAARD